MGNGHAALNCHLSLCPAAAPAALPPPRPTAAPAAGCAAVCRRVGPTISRSRLKSWLHMAQQVRLGGKPGGSRPCLNLKDSCCTCPCVQWGQKSAAGSEEGGDGRQVLEVSGKESKMAGGCPAACRSALALGCSCKAVLHNSLQKVLTLDQDHTSAAHHSTAQLGDCLTRNRHRLRAAGQVYAQPVHGEGAAQDGGRAFGIRRQLQLRAALAAGAKGLPGAAAAAAATAAAVGLRGCAAKHDCRHLLLQHVCLQWWWPRQWVWVVYVRLKGGRGVAFVRRLVPAALLKHCSHTAQC
jgi:hypothetical protein